MATPVNQPRIASDGAPYNSITHRLAGCSYLSDEVSPCFPDERLPIAAARLSTTPRKRPVYRPATTARDH